MSTIYVEGRQFGLEDRIELEANGKIVRDTDASAWTFPVLRTKIWSLLHGYGWPTNGGTNPPEATQWIHFETRRFTRPPRDIPPADYTCGGPIGELPGEAEDDQ